MLVAFSRKEATRTPDPYVPNVVRYQLRYFPICECKDTVLSLNKKIFAQFYLIYSRQQYVEVQLCNSVEKATTV